MILLEAGRPRCVLSRFLPMMRHNRVKRQEEGRLMGAEVVLVLDSRRRSEVQNGIPVRDLRRDCPRPRHLRHRRNHLQTRVNIRNLRNETSGHGVPPSF